MKVSLTKLVQTDAGPRYCPVVFARNGRVRPDYVVVNGAEEHHPEGAYYIDWNQNKKRKRLAVGKDAASAYAQKLRKEAELNAIAQGVPVTPDAQEEAGRSLNEAIAQYVEETRLTRKHKTFLAYKLALEYFAESCSQLYLEDIQRADLLKFHAYLRDEKELSPRSTYNKFESVMTFLKAQDIKVGVKKNDWPKYVEGTPEVYEKAELEKLYTVLSDQERLYYDFFLMTGLREQEVMHTFWSDVNFVRGTVTVSGKREYGFTPKNYRGREVPIPSKLLDALKDAKTKAVVGCPLLFPTSGCKPKNDFLDILKARAEAAGLDSDDFWLHKFRATFATWHLQAGVDLRTVQQWLGHTDLESTMRYLRPAQGHTVKSKVDATFA